MQFFLGTSGYTYRDWRGRFYPRGVPQRDWLSFYARTFRTVEINATFYGTFKPEHLQRWHDVTPQDFRFSIKGSRFITHIRRLEVTEEDIAKFFLQLEPLKDKLSCVLWQLPGTFRYGPENMDRLARFLELLPQEVRHCVEFRDSSWFVEPLWAILEKTHTGFVISETSEFPVFERVTSDFAYIRFHGPAKLYASKYTSEDLRAWSEKISSLLKKYDVYCYFNNDYYGYAIENAQMLGGMLQKTEKIEQKT